MERSHLAAVLLGLLALAAGYPAAVGAQSTVEASCEPSVLATQVSLFCAPDMPTAQCCEPVVASVDLGGGVPCLCRVAAEPQLIIAGLNATHLLTLYTACGGLRPGGARLAAACVGPAPPAAVFTAPPPPAAVRRKQPAREAPPPPATTEKLAPPPQQHGAATAKAIPTHPAAAAPLGPVAAPPPPQSSSSGVSTPLHAPLTAAAILAITLLLAVDKY